MTELLKSYSAKIGAVVVVQLAEWLLLTPENMGSDLVIGKFFQHVIRKL